LVPLFHFLDVFALAKYTELRIDIATQSLSAWKKRRGMDAITATAQALPQQSRNDEDAN